MSNERIDDETTALEIFVLGEYRAGSAATKDMEYRIPGKGVVIIHVRRILDGRLRFTLTDLDNRVYTYKGKPVVVTVSRQQQKADLDSLYAFAWSGVRAVFASKSTIQTIKERAA